MAQGLPRSVSSISLEGEVEKRRAQLPGLGHGRRIGARGSTFPCCSCLYDGACFSCCSPTSRPSQGLSLHQEPSPLLLTPVPWPFQRLCPPPRDLS